MPSTTRNVAPTGEREVHGQARVASASYRRFGAMAGPVLSPLIERDQARLTGRSRHAR